MRERIVAISAGHHPAAPGAVLNDPDTGAIITTEHAEARAYVDELCKQLEANSVGVRRIQPGTLTQKIRMVNLEPTVRCAVEIHFNSAVDAHGAHIGAGCEVLYCPGSTAGLALGNAVERRLGGLFPPARGVKPGWYRMDVPGQVDYPGDRDGDEAVDAWLRQCTCPSIIIEPEFIHRLQGIRDSRTAACAAILGGLLEWLDR